MDAASVVGLPVLGLRLDPAVGEFFAAGRAAARSAAWAVVGSALRASTRWKLSRNAPTGRAVAYAVREVVGVVIGSRLQGSKPGAHASAPAKFVKAKVMKFDNRVMGLATAGRAVARTQSPRSWREEDAPSPVSLLE